MAAPPPPGTVLLIGGTGKVGRSLAPLLRSASVPCLVASRWPSLAVVTGPADAATFDWHDRSTWAGPFAGARPPVSALWLVAPPVLDAAPLMCELVDFARRRGVGRVVMLGATVVEAGGPVFGRAHAYLQELGARGEIEYAVVRPSSFMGGSCFVLFCSDLI